MTHALPRKALVGPLFVTFVFLILALAHISAPTGAATTRELAITTASADPTVPFEKFDSTPIKLFDINGDGRKEIIAQNDNNWIYVFDSQTGKILFQAKTTFPSGWGARSFNGPEVAIMSGGGTVRLIVVNSAAYVTSYRYDPVGSSSTNFRLVKEWEDRANDCYSGPGSDSKPVLADLNKDGRFEILVTTEEKGIYAYKDNGDLYWKNCLGGGNAAPTVADVNLDGWPDVVHVSDGGLISLLNGRTGGWMWSYSAKNNFNLGSASIPVSAAVGQLDGQSGLDIVIGARDSHDPNNWDNDHALLLALDSNGKKLWARQDANGGNPLTYTIPVIADVDHDGKNEVYWADWNTNGHKPPFDASEAWQVTGPANFYRYDGAGNLVWKRTLGSFWNNKDIPIGDMTGDGEHEMLVNAPNANGRDGIWYLDTDNGQSKGFVDVWPYKVMRAPTLGDLYGRGTMQWVVGVAPYGSGSAHGILVYDTGVPYRATWPHPPSPPLGGGGGGGGDPPPPPPPEGGTFAATFTIKSPNAWWQEVYVDPSDGRTVSKVDLRINSGSWQAMSKSSWGAWTSSKHTPAGTKVEFRATDNSGGTSQSLPFTWMDGTLTQGSTTGGGGGGGGGGTFTANFTPTDDCNNWWVSVSVSSSSTISSVSVIVNNGAPVALEKKSWGPWAKSMHVPTGASVKFVAKNSQGDSATSETFSWLSDGGGGGGGGTFTASFEVMEGSNNWWVEVKVTSSQTVTKVEAQVNGGSWTDLPKTDWGTWAKSFHVADGSQVKFRAHNGSGDIATSDPITWDE